MKFTLRWASGKYESREIELNTIQELMDLIKEVDNDVIVSEEFKYIMVYDDYVE